MPDDKSKRGSPDNKRLNKSEPYEVAYAKSKRAGAARKSASTSKKREQDAASTADAGVEVGVAGDEADQRGAAPRSQARTDDARHPESAQGGEDGGEHGAADDARGRRRRPADRRPPRVGALFKQYEKLAKKEAPAEQRRAWRRRSATC